MEVAPKKLLDINGLGVLDDKPVILDAIAEGRGGLPISPAVIFLHSTLHILRQIQAVVFVHGLDHGLHDDAHLSLLDGLLYGQDLDLQLLAQDRLKVYSIVSVAGEAGKLPKQNRLKGLWLGLGGGDEPAEVVAAGGLLAGLRLIHKHIFIRHDITVLRAPFAYLHQLGGRGELRLLIGGHADVRGGGLIIRHFCAS